jgi:hypothetical protein
MRTRLEHDRPASSRAQAWWREYWRADFVRSQVAEIVNELTPVIGSPSEAYLREQRGIDVSAISAMLERTDAIGWHPQVWFGDQGHPLHGQKIGALIGVMTDPVTAKPTGAISRTYFDPAGCRIGTKALGSPMGVVRLSTDADVLGGLHIAESIENSLKAAAFGFTPIWSTAPVSVMAVFPVLSGVEALTILHDHDAGGAAERLVQRAASRWIEAGREVRVIDLREVVL